MKGFGLIGLMATMLAGIGAAHALTVVEPAVATRVVAGDDFTTSILANPWDMADAQDIAIAESGQLAAQNFSGGVFGATTTGDDPGFYLLHHGLPGTINLSRGQRDPIDTSRFRHLTMKLRISRPGGPPLAMGQPLQVFFIEHEGEFSIPGTWGQSIFRNISPEQWQIVSFDLVTDHIVGFPEWQSFDRVAGLRVDPTVQGGVLVEVDWATLTADATPEGGSFNVSWTDTGAGPYAIDAIDSMGTSYPLASNIAGLQATVSMPRLPPGAYRIRVSRGLVQADSPGLVIVNPPSLPDVIDPDAQGELSLDYAARVVGNPWGPYDPSDILLAGGIETIRYDDPPGSGSLVGRPNSGDPGLVFKSPAGVDTREYRSLCYRLQVFGERNIGAGSVARVFWGQALDSFSTSLDIIVETGLNQYCLENLGDVPLVAGSPYPWAGTMAHIRLDPHEFPSSPGCQSNAAICRDFRLDQVTLSPHDRADPEFRVRWSLSNPDGDPTHVAVFLDSDRIVDNGNERLMGMVASATDAELRWVAPSRVPDGLYHVYVEADDGRTSIGRYGSGRLQVGHPVGPGNRLFVDGFEP